jgi:hypothetical protein
LLGTRQKLILVRVEKKEGFPIYYMVKF